MGPVGCPKMSVRNYHCWLCNNQKSAFLIFFTLAAWNHTYSANSL